MVCAGAESAGSDSGLKGCNSFINEVSSHIKLFFFLLAYSSHVFPVGRLVDCGGVGWVVREGRGEGVETESFC